MTCHVGPSLISVNFALFVFGGVLTRKVGTVEVEASWLSQLQAAFWHGNVKIEQLLLLYRDPGEKLLLLSVRNVPAIMETKVPAPTAHASRLFRTLIVRGE